MDSDSESRVNYQRIFKFVRRLLNRSPELCRLAEVPIENGSPRSGEGFINKLYGYEGGEIEVEFRHKDGSKIWTGGSVGAPPIFSKDQTRFQKVKTVRNGCHFAHRNDQENGRHNQEKGLQKLERDARGKGLKEHVTSIKGDGKKEANHLVDQATMMNDQPREDTKSRPPKDQRPPFNINVMSEKYIERKRRDFKQK